MRFRYLPSVLGASWPSVGVFVTFLAFIYPLRAPSGFTLSQWIWIGVVAALSAFAAYRDIRRSSDERVLHFNKQDKIDQYMRDWINCDGHVAISSHDMTWVNRRHENLEILEAKARRKELTIYLPKETDLSRRLEAAGAEILTYTDLNYTPESRFTIINVGRIGAKVAIGRAGDKKQQWIIEEFRSGEHPAFHLAQDLTEILRRHATKGTRA